MTAARNTSVHKHVGGLSLSCTTLPHVSYEDFDAVPWWAHTNSELTSASE